MTAQVKICGVKTPEALNAAIEAGARYIGFVFYPPSPRHIEIDTAKELAGMLPTGVRGVGLFVDPSDEELDAVLGKVQLDIIQLHNDETPARVSEIKAKYHMPIIKAFPVREESDIAHVGDYTDADWYLFDAKSADPNMPGGTGKSFDWSILSEKTFDKPWMLSGGLSAENIADALTSLSPNAVDVSSGVERSRGVKDENKIRAFIEAVKGV
ncbi:MAG: phosphoribosylanthranilate isomerase [Alcanivorax sp.]